MPATNYTPIQLYRSTTSGNLPLAANLSPGELALNIADNDMTMYMENASGVVKSFFNNPAALKYPTADGTSGQFLTTNGAGVLSFGSVAAGALTNNTRQAVTSSATTTLDLNSGNVIDLTMAANITSLSFTNVPASGTPILIQIVVRNASNGTSYSITWPSSVYWSGQYTANTFSNVQVAPTLATGSNGITVIALLTTDGGTKWRGWVEATIPGTTNYTLFTWGNQVDGKLGQNQNVSFVNSPVQIGSLTNWFQISTGTQHCLAVKTDGTLWSWGNNYRGMLGQNQLSNQNKSSPVQVGSLTTWSQAAAASTASAAVKTDGTLWTWGDYNGGALGQGSNIHRSSPVQVGALTDWISIVGGNRRFFSIKANGTLWAWGYGFGGATGFNNSSNYNSPKQVGALTNWASVSSSVYGNSTTAVKTDGTLWSWGVGTWGQLGQGSAINVSSPVQVGAETNWATVINNNLQGMAVKTTGTLWAWGNNDHGTLGQNDLVSRSSPIQVGALTTWSKIAISSQNAAFAISTTNRLWSWGRYNDGQLGQSYNISRSSPVQVGSATDWYQIKSGGKQVNEGFAAGIRLLQVNPA